MLVFLIFDIECYVLSHKRFKRQSVFLSLLAVSSPVLSAKTLLKVPKWTSWIRQFRSVKVCVGGCGCSLCVCVCSSSLWAAKTLSADVSQLVDLLCCAAPSWISLSSVISCFYSEILFQRNKVVPHLGNKLISFLAESQMRRYNCQQQLLSLAQHKD